MGSKIKHSGVVDAINGECVKVRILQTSACAHCKVAGHCNSSDSKEKVVDVCNVRNTADMKIGDRVVVTVSVGIAANALLLGFGVPLIVMILALLVIYFLTSDEACAALGSITALVPYYAVLYMCRDRLREKMAFEIEDVLR